MNDVMLTKPVETRKKRKNLPLINTDDAGLEEKTKCTPPMNTGSKKVTADQHGSAQIRQRERQIGYEQLIAPRPTQWPTQISLLFLISENQCNPCHQW